MRISAPTAVRWRAGVIAALDGQAGLCRKPIRRRIKEKRVDVVVEGRKWGIAWGQFLDRDHHSGTHWGRFGTTAAVQVLAMDLHWHRDESARKDVMNVDPLMYLAHGVLVDGHSGPDFDDELKPDDFDDPMKVAFLVDAVNPDACDVVDSGTPPAIVERLLVMALDNTEGWSTRPEDDEDRLEKDRLLITAYALWALRRHPKAQLDRRIAGAAGWLANELLEGLTTLGQDLIALGALALAYADPEVRARPKVEDAIAATIVELRGWVRGIREPAIGRPYFNSYSRGSSNDYIFLSPELLTALLFLKEEEERRSRTFVLSVVKAVAENVLPKGMPARFREEPHGFSIQRGMEGTVDQMWAMRLLRSFHRRHKDDPHSLRPSRISMPGALTAIVAIAFVGVVATDPQVNVVNSLLLALLGAALSVVLVQAYERRSHSASK